MYPTSPEGTRGVRVATLDPKDVSRQLLPSSVKSLARLPGESLAHNLEVSVGSRLHVHQLLLLQEGVPGVSPGGILLLGVDQKARVLVKVHLEVDPLLDQDRGAAGHDQVVLDLADPIGHKDKGLSRGLDPDQAPISREAGRDHRRDRLLVMFSIRKR